MTHRKLKYGTSICIFYRLRFISAYFHVSNLFYRYFCILTISLDDFPYFWSSDVRKTVNCANVVQASVIFYSVKFSPRTMRTHERSNGQSVAPTGRELFFNFFFYVRNFRNYCSTSFQLLLFHVVFRRLVRSRATRRYPLTGNGLIDNTYHPAAIIVAGASVALGMTGDFHGATVDFRKFDTPF